jgi:hypothetical protein
MIILDIKTMNPVYINFEKHRQRRQIANYDKILQMLKNKDITLLHKTANALALERTLEYLNLDINDLIEECTKSEMFAKSIAMNIAIQ